MDLIANTQKTPACCHQRENWIKKERNEEQWQNIWSKWFVKAGIDSYDLEFIVRSHSQAPINDPLAIDSCPWLAKVTPTLSRVPLKAVYMVAICNIEALLAALSDCRNRMWVSDSILVLNLLMIYLEHSHAELYFSRFKLFREFFDSVYPVWHRDSVISGLQSIHSVFIS